VAWLANQLVRAHRDEIEPLLALGADLREATANLSGERLRELSKQQHQVVYALVQQAKGLAAAAGRRVSSDTERGLEDTLRAALADGAAAEQLVAGRLTDALAPGGFGSPSPSDQSARPSRTRRAPGAPGAPGASGTAGAGRPAESVDQRRARRIEEAERALAEAEEAATDSAETRDSARASLQSAEAQTMQARAQVKQLDEELERATGEQSRSEAAQRKARTTLDRAERNLSEARRKVELASARRDRIGEAE
jgi:hypothetical protein